MHTLMKALMQKSEVKEFMAENPVHDAVVKAFDKHFEKGFTLEDLPFLVFTKKSHKERTVKKVA